MPNHEERAQLELQIQAHCASGDKQRAATVLLEGYGREILGFLISRLRDQNAAGEVFSAFTEDLWRGLDGFGWRCSARVWAYTLARHAASHYVRSARRQRARLAFSNTGELEALEHKLRTETLASAQTESKDRITQLRESLPADDQTLLILRINRQLAWTEIAQVMLHEGEVVDATQLERDSVRLRQRFHAAKKRLRLLAIEAGLVNADGDET